LLLPGLLAGLVWSRLGLEELDGDWKFVSQMKVCDRGSGRTYSNDSVEEGMVDVSKVEGVCVGCDCERTIGCAGEGVGMTSDGAVTTSCERARAGRASRTKDEMCIFAVV